MKKTRTSISGPAPATEPGVLTEEAEPPGTPADAVGLPAADNCIETAAVPGSGPDRAGRSPMSLRTLEFRERFYPDAGDALWNDWRWQWRNRIRDRQGLERILVLTDAERGSFDSRAGLPVSITPYYASLLSPTDPVQPLRRTVVPSPGEFVRTEGEAEDPLAEDADSPVPGLVHRYPDRVLFLVTGVCSVYCRYCTRSRMIGGRRHCFNPQHWEAALGYIENHPEVRDVLLSGGDPLTMPGERIEWLLSRLQAIGHVEIVRIGTKVPVVLPQRITSALVGLLRRHQPLWMSIHFTHPDELTPEAGQACARLADAGIPLGSQTVLLKGINDDVETLRRLFHGLLRFRVRPYYLYQCDPIVGSADFRTSVAKGLEIIEGLRGHTSGYAVPTFVVDAPGGGGKIPLLPDHIVGRAGRDLLLRNYAGRMYRYPDAC